MNNSIYSASCKKVTIGTAGATAEQLAAIKDAIATKNDAHIKSVVANINNPPAPEPTPEPSENPGDGSL